MALKLHLNIYPHREFLGRVQTGTNVGCWHCAYPQGTLGHILGICLTVQEVWILWHNKLCNILAVEGKKRDWTVYYELHLHNAAREL